MPRTKRRKLHEADIKVALLNWYRANGKLADACVISEMVVANWRHRIDLIVVTDQVNAFEIKSDFDNLKRLKSQMKAFAPRFDRLAVVCPPKFSEKVTKEVPEGVEVLEYSAEVDPIAFHIVKSFPEEPRADKAGFISILKKTQLAKFLRSKGMKFSGAQRKAFLAKLASNLSWEELRQAVTKVLKARYFKTSNDFLGALQEGKPISVADLDRLVKWKTFRRSRKNRREEEVEF